MTNKLIDDIARKAGLSWAEDVGCGFPEIKYPVGYEKFAEMIIRECASTDFRTAVGVSNQMDYEITEAILNKFGVK